MIILEQLTGHPQVSLGVVNPVEHVRPTLKCDALQSYHYHHHNLQIISLYSYIRIYVS